ncbi:lipoprotein [Limnohabitans sp. Jir72]|uniref:LPS translocon maturation chaperone LptM n=1 Tax=Limnohabitans sp. Jir72 TaxID=1977909 RepID=UPI000D3DAA5D|nr:lipoprotein [Limnohabitans sp. Jir72]PUE34370.1 hypothetical protein B9Z52_05540 [Limnohabitans sp. Jir72]
MLKVLWILVRTLTLAVCAVALCACGQKGALKLPDTPASAGRATLPQSINPWHVAPPRTQRPKAQAQDTLPADTPAAPELGNDTTPSSSYLKP